MAKIQFDARQVAPDSGGVDPVPEGWYVVAIDQSDIKPTSDKNGAYVEVRERIVEPAEFRGKIVFGRLNIQNANPKAVEIGLAQLSALCHATGVLVLDDTQQLHNIQHKIKVTFEPAREEKNENTGEVKKYGASNNIRAFKPMSENVVIGPVAGATPAPAAPAPSQVPASFAPSAPAPAAIPQAPAQQAPAGQPAWAQQPQQPWQQAPAAPAAAPAAQGAGFTPPWAAQPAAAPAQQAQQPQAAAPAPIAQPPAGGVVPPWQRPAA